MSDTEEKRLFLKSAHLKGFKSIEDLTVEFKPGLNVLIGKKDVLNIGLGGNPGIFNFNIVNFGVIP